MEIKYAIMVLAARIRVFQLVVEDELYDRS
jgi:hypothetical protein